MASSERDLDWQRDGNSWPHAEFSRFEALSGLTLHVQAMGCGPVMLLVHGTGASGHSWSGLATLLAPHFRVVVPDLPGHGFSAAGSGIQSSLPGMARVLAELLERWQVEPALVVGHSAGAAILAQMALDGAIAPRALVSVNGALLPLRGLAGHLFAPAARLLAALPPVARLFSRRAADRRLVERLVRDTGSDPPAAMIDCYQRLLRSPRHLAGTLRMMANWDVEPLARRLEGLAPLLFLVACDNDRTVPPAEARRLHRLLPASHLIEMPGLGHLGHEEAPARFAELLMSIAAGPADRAAKAGAGSPPAGVGPAILSNKLDI